MLQTVKKVISDIYGDQLINVVLYGSFARNTFKDDSDIDIAVILKGKISKGNEIDRIYNSIYDLQLETGELVSVNPISEDEFESSPWPLFHHIKTEGLVL